MKHTENKTFGYFCRIFLGILLLLTAIPGMARPATSIISVLDLHNNAGLSEFETSYLTDLARDALARNLPYNTYTIMTRESILELLPEGTRLSDCLDASCEVEIGRILGADYVVSGEILEFAGEQRLILKVHRCDSAAFIGSEIAAGAGLKELESRVSAASGLLAGRISKHQGTGKAGVSFPSPDKPVISLDDWIIQSESGYGRARQVAGQMIPMVAIEPGEFLMGSPRYEQHREKDEDRHQVTLSRRILMGSTEVTQGQWSAVMGLHPSHFSGALLPVESITFSECLEFCNRLSDREGLIPAYGFRNGEIFWNREADGYRLPTEAEWEYACRAGSQQRFTNGDNLSDMRSVSWTRHNSTGRTHEVGSKQANQWGLYDMHGNVWEWCWNWSSAYPDRFASDPEGPDVGSSRVIRGGSWDNSHEACRSANHNSAKSTFKASILGFRVTRTVSN